ncbi:tRNA lysidine(34) synthetase TilS [Rhodoplanes sp. SY1]|uniref:tRNA lysidine(34) synthetase TilS n=1 Tax=Rhodoplanes sp. SY1 TaxID=3166646 RepID=UPI0038B68D95
MTPRGDALPLGDAEAAALFADLAPLPALILAVSGGPDSTALLWLAARWRATLTDGPRLVAVTVDHGLRRQSIAEAEAVGGLAERLGVAHRVLRWTGDKPAAGLQEAARAARYRLLTEVAHEVGAAHVLTAHTRDDQAETVLFRLARGSGLSGLAGMARTAAVPLAPPASPLPARGERSDCAPQARNPGEGAPPRTVSLDTPPHPSRRCAASHPLPARGERDQVPLLLLRPFLDVPKARLVATLRAAGVAFADDASNRDPRFTRSRLRLLLPGLAAEGLSAACLARFAERMRRADAALEAATDRLARDLGIGRGTADPPPGGAVRLDALAWAKAPEELRIRLLGRLVAAAAAEGPVELGKLESVAAALAAALAASAASPVRDGGSGTAAPAARFRRTLAGAMVTLSRSQLTVEPAPARRAARNAARRPRDAEA